MNNIAVIEKENYVASEIQPAGLNYTDNLSVQKLLDTIASIIAVEYINKVKQNPEIFLENGGNL